MEKPKVHMSKSMDSAVAPHLSSLSAEGGDIVGYYSCERMFPKLKSISRITRVNSNIFTAISTTLVVWQIEDASMKSPCMRSIFLRSMQISAKKSHLPLQRLSKVQKTF
ncbi:hypothetical protein M9H77_05062 [Catharanthus roseus]|uniref:Uncharacterized protein n=1 Tax=Catharanthus roseus TaxID=4058 RepID=A0ACC0CGB3_CATRO|nr:hypothetical protein M9H77_05062 [Catharanthus roseus]